MLFVVQTEFHHSALIDVSSNLTRSTLKESLQNGIIPKKLMPYLNITAVEEGVQHNNGSLDFIIRDEDVADDSDTVLQVNEVFHDGNKTIVKISDDATYQLLQKWMDQAASGLLSAIVAKKWITVLNEIRDEANRLKEKKTTKRKMQKKFANYKKTMEELGIDSRIAFTKMGMPNFLDDMPSTTDTIEKNDNETETETLTDEQKAIRKPLMLIRDGVKLGMMLAGKNTSNFDEKKISIISPQFMSVLPDEQGNNTINLLSPSVFAFHEQGNELENEISLSRVMRVFSDNGQEDWMNFVLEASGVTEAVDKMREDERKQEEESWRKQFTNENGQPMYFTKQNVTEMYGDFESSKIDAMDAIHKSMSAYQMKEMNETGYSIMSKQQISMLYGPQSPYNNSHAYEKFIKMSRDEIPEMVEVDIQKLAHEEMQFKVRRQKDITLSPVLFTWIALSPETASQPIVLSPLVFSPLILSPSALGPLILSPWIFSPLILSPRVLAPIILSPTIFSPLILSPLALSPLILSPAVAVPLILSPFVLTPFILSPLVMVPVILNPFCLSPLLAVPNTLSPIILSPFVLSPFILSPPYVNAFVLSPYALSPIIWSDGLLFTAVLSPSWLSSL